MWYWIFLWALFSSLFVHGAAGVLMFVMLQRHRQGRVISVIAVSIGFLASVTGAMITSNNTLEWCGYLNQVQPSPASTE
ncbi:transmembrane protein 170A isoform X3 [Prionailurus iriomotensis]